MSFYQTVASAFSRIGLAESALLSESEIYQALNKLARNNGLTQYDPNVAEQLWNQTAKTSSDKVYLRDYISTIVKGQSLVRSSIIDLQQEIQNKTDREERNQLLQDLTSYTQDLKYLTLPFGAPVPRESRVVSQSRASNPVQNRSTYSHHTSVIFSKQIPENQSDNPTDLKIAYMLTILLIFAELILMFHKHHFTSLLAYLSVLAIYFLGYFDQYYMKFVKVMLLVAIILDLIWLFVNFGEYWNPNSTSQHTSLQGGFLKFILFFILITAALKLILIGMIFKYRNNTSQMRKNLSILGQKYQVYGNPNSPIAKLFAKSYQNLDQ